MVFSLLLCFTLSAGCRSLPFDAGKIKQERPYSDGVWLGPRDATDYERTLLAGDSSAKKTNAAANEWRRLKAQIKPGDELWEFAANPYAVDGGTRYFGIALVRSGRIVSRVITAEIE